MNQWHHDKLKKKIDSLKYKVSIYRKLNKDLVKKQEKKIINHFKFLELNPDNLNYVMKRVNLPLLMENLQ